MIIKAELEVTADPVVEPQSVEETNEPSLSLAELDMVGGGYMSLAW